jgi:thioredoxin-like negative regulator of GroEL
VNHEAPASFAVRWDGGASSYQGLGDALELGLPIPMIRGAELSGELDVGLCDDAKTACRFASYAVEGYVGAARKGEVRLALRRGGADDAHADAVGGIGKDAAVAAAEAFERASASGELVMLDFGAVWCPPCNVLAAEVLSDPQAVDGFVVATLDVDDRSSFELKHRYEVGGYPTVVVTDPEGRELSRYVGYDGRDEFVGWLDSLRSGDGALPDDPATVDAARAAEVAWALAGGGRGASVVQPWLDAADPEALPARLARVAVAPTPADVRWLAEHDIAFGDWFWSARALFGDDAELAEVARAALERALPTTEGAPAADLLYALATLSDDDPVLYGAAAAVQRSLLTGDPVHDKGHLSGLADLLALAGDADAAEALLRRSARLWPDEPTFYLSLAYLYLDEGRHEDALAATSQGMPVSWDDNRLRMAALQAKALVGLERVDEATELVDAVLAEVPAPQDGLGVRSFRYRDALRAVVEPASE